MKLQNMNEQQVQREEDIYMNVPPTMNEPPMQDDYTIQYENQDIYNQVPPPPYQPGYRETYTPPPIIAPKPIDDMQFGLSNTTPYTPPSYNPYPDPNILNTQYHQQNTQEEEQQEEDGSEREKEEAIVTTRYGETDVQLWGKYTRAKFIRKHEEFGKKSMLHYYFLIYASIPLFFFKNLTLLRILSIGHILSIIGAIAVFATGLTLGLVLNNPLKNSNFYFPTIGTIVAMLIITGATIIFSFFVKLWFRYNVKMGRIDSKKSSNWRGVQKHYNNATSIVIMLAVFFLAALGIGIWITIEFFNQTKKQR